MKRRSIIQCGILLIAIGLTLLTLLSMETSAATITVAEDGSQDYTSIQEAIDYATDGDTINVYAGTYNENIIVGKTLTLIGKGSGAAIIQGENSGSVVHITAPWVNMSKFSVRGGGDLEGDAAIKVEGDHCNISRNECSNGNRTGIHIKGSDHATVANNTITTWKTVITPSRLEHMMASCILMST